MESQRPTEFRRAARTTVADVAAAAGVSPATVSNVFNRPDRTSAELRSRVEEAAERLGYSPNPMARSLRRGRAGAIGVLVPERPTYAFSDPAGVALLDGLAEALGSDETGFLILSGDGTGGGPSPGTVAHAMVDAFVLYCLSDDDPCLPAALRRNVPMICVEGPALADAGWLIEIDDRAGTKELTEHLLDAGHRHLAHITMEVRPDGGHGLATADRMATATFGPTRRRHAGWADALTAAGLDPAAMPVYETAHNHPSAGTEAALALLDRQPRPTALVCQSDQLALGVMAAAAQLGLSVPEDLSVTGFDDIEAAALTRPALTTVHQPLREKGVTAGRLAAEALAGQPERLVQLPVETMLRDSTAPPLH